MNFKCKSRENGPGLVVDVKVEIENGKVTVYDKLEKTIAWYGIDSVGEVSISQLTSNTWAVTVPVREEFALNTLIHMPTYEFYDLGMAEAFVAEIQQQKDQL